MTTQKVAVPSRQISNNVARCLISAAVSAAIAGTALPQRAAAADSDQLAEVTVTGSRIVRSRDLEGPSPIATISKDSFENTQATGLEVVLNQQPQFVPQNTQFTSGRPGLAHQQPGRGNLEPARPWPEP